MTTLCVFFHAYCLVGMYETIDSEAIIMSHTFTFPNNTTVSSYATVLISAHREANTAHQDASQHKLLAARLTALVGEAGFIPVDGWYMGVQEHSYLVKCHDMYDVLKVQGLGTIHRQECVLVIDHINERVLLQYMDGQTVLVGREFNHVESTKDAESFTVIDGEAYIVE